MLHSCEKSISRKKYRFFHHWEISISCTTTRVFLLTLYCCFYHIWLKTVWIVSLQISHEMISNSHVQQLTVPFNHMPPSAQKQSCVINNCCNEGLIPELNYINYHSWLVTSPDSIITQCFQTPLSPSDWPSGGGGWNSDYSHTWLVNISPKSLNN